MKYLGKANGMCADQCNGVCRRFGGIERSVLLHVQMQDFFLTVSRGCWVFSDMAGGYGVFLGTEVHCGDARRGGGREWEGSRSDGGSQ